MCTLIALHRSVEGQPLVVAANRDEYLDRAAEGLALRRSPTGWWLAPLDARAGGTWLGLAGPRNSNRRGDWLFAGLTNLRAGDPDPNRKTRGEIVTHALAAADATAAATQMGDLAADLYNPFQCFVADAEHAYLVVYDGTPAVSALLAGVHVVGNADTTSLTPTGLAHEAGEDAAAAPEACAKTNRVAHEALASVDLPREARMQALARITRSHGNSAAGAPRNTRDARSAIGGGDPLADTCVHVGDTYGTRSSLLLELADDFEQSRMYVTEGPPCVNEYQDVSSLLHELRQAPGYGAAEILERKAS